MAVSDFSKVINDSFSRQAENFESDRMQFSNQDYLSHIVKQIAPQGNETVLDVAAGTGLCARALAPFVQEAVCVDATEEMRAQGIRKAKEEGISNIRFLPGFAEALPFSESQFDIVISRLAFHHFLQTQPPFSEMVRVLKPGGKLVIIDMEAAEEPLRDIEDRLETLRDPSHVRNQSAEELKALYRNASIPVSFEESVRIPVSLDAWLDLTETPAEHRHIIRSALQQEQNGGAKTGFSPFLKNEALYFEQRWLCLIGEKPLSALNKKGVSV